MLDAYQITPRNEYSIDFTSVPNQPAFASQFYNLNFEF